jgi:Cdc6-like AAA superfamily ATPase
MFNILIFLLLPALVAAALTIWMQNNFSLNGAWFNRIDWGSLALISILPQNFITQTLVTNSILVGVWMTWYVFLLTLIVVLKFKLTKEQVDYSYSSGIKLLESKKAAKHAQQYIYKLGDKSPVRLHPDVPLTEKILAGNVFCYGQQGTGKSTIIKGILGQLAKTSHHLFIFDLKKEYPEFLAPSNTCILRFDETINTYWDIGQDVINITDAADVSVALINEDSTKDDFFTNAAREVVKGVLISLVQSKQKWSWQEFNGRLFAPHSQLQSILADSHRPAAVLIEDNNKTTQSIRSVISAQLGWLPRMVSLSVKAEEKFSIKRWLSPELTTPRQVVFQPNINETTMSGALCNAITSIITSTVLNMSDNEDHQVWQVLDELGNLPKSHSLERWLSLSRAKGGRMLAGAQNIDQLQRYGDKSANIILSLFKTNIVLAMGTAGESCRAASKALGNQRVLSVQRSKSTKEGLNFSEQFSDRAVVSPEDIANLPLANSDTGVSGYAYIGGANAVYKLIWPFPTKWQEER